MDAESFQKLWEAELKARPPFPMIPEPKLIQTLIEMMAHQAAVMEEMCEHLRAIREATETEAVEDAEPDPFQTLNGPKTISGDGHSTVFSYPEGTTISEP